MMKNNERYEEMETMVKGIEYKTTGEILIIAAVMMYIVSAFSFLILPFSDNMNVFIFGLLIAGATGMVIYGGFQLSYFNKLNKMNEDDIDMIEDSTYNTEEVSGRSTSRKIAKKRKDSVSSMFGTLATIVYLYIGFFYGLWHPGWLVFLLIPVANGLYDLLRMRETY